MKKERGRLAGQQKSERHWSQRRDFKYIRTSEKNELSA